MTLLDLDWRKLEAAIIACARRAMFELDEDAGDKLVCIPNDYPANTINATEFAKDLAKELGL